METVLERFTYGCDGQMFTGFLPYHVALVLLLPPLRLCCISHGRHTKYYYQAFGTIVLRSSQ